jgi:hypothetical protein
LLPSCCCCRRRWWNGREILARKTSFGAAVTYSQSLLKVLAGSKEAEERLLKVKLATLHSLSGKSYLAQK